MAREPKQLPPQRTHVTSPPPSRHAVSQSAFESDQKSRPSPTNERARLATLSHLAANFARSWLSCSLPVIDSLQFGLFARHLLLYRVVHLVANLGWVDMNFDYSTVCLILPGLMGVWQKRLGIWARWWNSQIQVKRTQVRDQMGHPVDILFFTL